MPEWSTPQEENNQQFINDIRNRKYGTIFALSKEAPKRKIEEDEENRINIEELDMGHGLEIIPELPEEKEEELLGN